MRRLFSVILAAIALVSALVSWTSFGEPARAQSRTAQEQLAVDIYKQLVEINTVTATGDTAPAAGAMAARLRNAGFGESDVQVFTPAPRKGNLVARLRGTGARKPILLLAHLDVVEARREDWSVDPFNLIEKDGYFYGELDIATREGGSLDLRANELYLDFEDLSRLWNQDRQLNLRTGQFYIPFGEEYLMRYAINNPLISHSVSDLWGVDPGVELYGTLGKFHYVLAVQNGGIDNLNTRVNAWWAMAGIVGLALVTGRTGVTLLFAFASFVALREFVAPARGRPSPAAASGTRTTDAAVPCPRTGSSFRSRACRGKISGRARAWLFLFRFRLRSGLRFGLRFGFRFRRTLHGFCRSLRRPP